MEFRPFGNLVAAVEDEFAKITNKRLSGVALVMKATLMGRPQLSRRKSGKEMDSEVTITGLPPILAQDKRIQSYLVRGWDERLLRTEYCGFQHSHTSRLDRLIG